MFIRSQQFTSEHLRDGVWSKCEGDRTSTVILELRLVAKRIHVYSLRRKIFLCLPQTSMDLFWKVLLTEGKTQFGVQKCELRICRIMKIAVKKKDVYRKIRVNLMHVHLTFEKFALI